MRIRRKTYAASSAAFALSASIAIGADAQEVRARSTPRAPATATPTPIPSAVVTVPVEPAPVIAEPGPAASPAKVEKALEVAKKAELTPIVPVPEDATRPAFQLFAEVDLPVLGAGLVFAGARLIRSQPAFCAPLCNPADLNAIDKTTAGYWSVPWQTGSDVGLYSIFAGAAVLLVLDEGPVAALNDAVVVAESALTATAIASVIALAAGRPRPFLYGTDAPLSARSDGNGGLSFVSSHAAVAFATVMATYMATLRLNPNSKLPLVVLGVGGLMASFVAVARVLGGQHFIIDAVGGGMIGASTGVLVPALHSSPVKIVPVVSETQRGLGIAGVF
jgi:membrane-associated phospholipid phosphatase